MEASVDSFRLQYGNLRAPVVCAIKNDKEEQSIGELLASISSQVMATQFAGSQDWPIHAVDPELLADVLRGSGLENVSVDIDPYHALEAELNSGNKLIIVTGSFYLVSQLRQWLLEQSAAVASVDD